MFLFALSFLCGDVFLQNFSTLPGKILIYFFWIALFVFFFFYSKKYFYILIGLLLGFSYTAWYAQSILSSTLPKEMEGRTIRVGGTIASLPIVENQQISFIFALKNLEFKNQSIPIKINARLTWHNPPLPLKVGDQWQLTVRLKQIHSTQSPGSFDYEAWALQKNIRASGSVLVKMDNHYLQHTPYHYLLDQWRQKWLEKLKSILPQSPTSPWLLALILGERTGIPAADWQVLRKTGTNHLMAIAGLHIGLIAGFVYCIINFIWRRIPILMHYFTAQEASAFVSLFIAIFYSALAGFSLPTERAVIMLTVFVVMMVLRRPVHHWYSWSFALLIVLMMNPLSVLAESFWLSFATIALIIYGMSNRLSPKGLWWHYGRVQYVIGIGLIPLTLFFFQEASLISLFVNAIAIPWLGFFILPFCLLAAFFLFLTPMLSHWCLVIADKSLSMLWVVLTWCSHLSFASWHIAFPNFTIFFITMMAFLFILLPAGCSLRWLACIWFLPIVLYQPPLLKPGEIKLSLLDVGQGLSVLVQTKTHALIYDAGPKYLNRDSGEDILLPFLRLQHLPRIDMLVISHGDNDHIGGAASVLHAFTVKSIYTSVPEKLSLSHFCLAGSHWEWDGVHFSFLYPSLQQLQQGNNSSCVLSIRNSKERILLTGDIEKEAENELVKNNSKELPATILVAPHHGSKTSVVPEFVRAVHPEIVLYATAYHNRYHFPHETVVKAYHLFGAQQFNTAETGTMQLSLKQDEARVIEWYRASHKRYWY